MFRYLTLYLSGQVVCDRGELVMRMLRLQAVDPCRGAALSSLALVQIARHGEAVHTASNHPSKEQLWTVWTLSKALIVVGMII